MKISYSEYIKKADVSVLVAESIFTDLLSSSDILKIKDVAKTTSGGTPNRSNADFYNGEIPWLKSGELNDGIIKESEEFITKDGLNNSSAKLHPKGTLLVAMYGATAGKAGILNFEASTNQAVCAIYPNDKVERDYLFWFFRSHRFQYIEKSKGGAQPNISQSVINETLIPVPNKNLQVTIAELLFHIEKDGTVDIESIPEQFRDSVYKVLSFKNSGQNISTELNHQLDLVKQLRQAFLREAMQGKLVSQDPNDEPASVLLEKIKAEKERLVKEKNPSIGLTARIKKQKPLLPITQEEIPFDIPENWVWCRLGEVTINHDGSRVPLSKYERSLMQGEFDYYGAMDVIDHINDYKFDGTYLLIAEDGQNLLRKNKPVAFLAHGKFWVNNHAHVSDCYHDITRIVVANFINTIDLAPHISGKPPSQIKLKRSALDLIPFPFPPLSEQQRIVAKLDELMQYCDELEESIKESHKQNELLLQQVLREALEPKEKEAAQ